MNLRNLAAALTVPALGLALAACGGGEAVTTESGAKIVEEGKLTVCTHLPYEPFEFTDSGEVVGFDIDIVDIAAKAEGLEVEVVDTPWETIVSGESLKNDDCDVALGAMTITEERAAVMDFSDAYFQATQALLVPADSKVADLASLAGKKIAVQEGTTGETYVKENLPEGAKSVSYEDSVLMMEAVRNGDVDAGVNDNGLVNYYVEQNPEVKVATEFSTGEEYGLAVKKDGNDKLLEVLNKAIASPDYDTAYKKWFGESSAQ